MRAIHVVKLRRQFNTRMHQIFHIDDWKHNKSCCKRIFRFMNIISSCSLDTEYEANKMLNKMEKYELQHLSQADQESGSSCQHQIYTCIFKGDCLGWLVGL